MVTLYRIVKRSVTESVLDRASVHNRDATFGTICAPKKDYFAQLVKDVIPATQQINFCNAPFHYPEQCEQIKYIKISFA